MIPARSKLAELYGVIEQGIWVDQPLWMINTTIPRELRPYWKYNKKTTNTMYLHKDMLEPLWNVWQNIIAGRLEYTIESFDGCFAIRTSRRDSKLSVHSYGLAIDLNAKRNRLGQKPTISYKLVDCFEQAGFIWGGRWGNPDGMHFQYVTED